MLVVAEWKPKMPGFGAEKTVNEESSAQNNAIVAKLRK
jgi:hypothetical protein